MNSIFDKRHPKAKSVYHGLVRWGFDPRKSLSAAQSAFGWYRRDRKLFLKQKEESEFGHLFLMGLEDPLYGDRNDFSGTARGAYFYQDLIVAQDIFARDPSRHIDVGSSVYGFVSYVASFRKIDVIDVRPNHSEIPNICFMQIDLSQSKFETAQQTDSLSCLHALEHFGLGRYGDPIDFDGWIKGLKNLYKLLQPRGILYLSLPTGEPQRVEFNAQRVFSLPFQRSLLTDYFDIVDLSFVDDEGNLHLSVDPFGFDSDRTFGSYEGCAIWTLEKSKFVD